jgi:hypothetical protein
VAAIISYCYVVEELKVEGIRREKLTAQMKFVVDFAVFGACSAVNPIFCDILTRQIVPRQKHNGQARVLSLEKNRTNFIN